MCLRSVYHECKGPRRRCLRAVRRVQIVHISTIYSYVLCSNAHTISARDPRLRPWWCIAENHAALVHSIDAARVRTVKHVKHAETKKSTVREHNSYNTVPYSVDMLCERISVYRTFLSCVGAHIYYI